MGQFAWVTDLGVNLRGSIYVGHDLWINLCGSRSMGQFVCVTLCWTICVCHIMLVNLCGSLIYMGQFAWVNLSGA